MKFEKVHGTKKQQTFCEWKTTHPKGNRSGLWQGTWAGWSIGVFCTDCRDEWERMRDANL